MTRWLRALYPRRFRARYGDEMCDLLARSEHHHRDLVDIAIHGVALRWEDTMARSRQHVANVPRRVSEASAQGVYERACGHRASSPSRIHRMVNSASEDQPCGR